jgi:hypothetical protein
VSLLIPPIPLQQETYNPVPNEIINWMIRVLNGNAPGAAFVSDWSLVGIEFVIDGGGTAIQSGIKGDLEIPFDCKINRATLVADQTTNMVVDVWRAPYAAFPPTAANSITGGNPPTITGALDYQDSALAGWDTAINAGDILRYNVVSVSAAQRVTLSLKATKI